MVAVSTLHDGVCLSNAIQLGSRGCVRGSGLELWLDLGFACQLLDCHGHMLFLVFLFEGINVFGTRIQHNQLHACHGCSLQITIGGFQPWHCNWRWLSPVILTRDFGRTVSWPRSLL